MRGGPHRGGRPFCVHPRHEAERELSGRVERRKQLDIVPLPEPARQQYIAQWQRVQADFVDAPVASVRQADVLVSQVMTDGGYPVAEFDQRAEDVSVDHPNVVENYRSAHAITVASGRVAPIPKHSAEPSPSTACCSPTSSGKGPAWVVASTSRLRLPPHCRPRRPPRAPGRRATDAY